MRKDFSDRYESYELYHWWFSGRAEIIKRVCEIYIPSGNDIKILDIGTGPGFTARNIKHLGSIIGLDVSLNIASAVKKGCIDYGVIGRGGEAPFKKGTVDVITAFDFLEHAEEDEIVLKEMAGLLKRRGRLILTVPAFMFLWGNQDIVNRHCRRYTFSSLRQKIHKAGFKTLYGSYFNIFLFLPVCIVRLLRRITGGTTQPRLSDFAMTKPGIVNNILTAIFSLERHLIGRIRLPAGVSIIIVAESL